MSGRARERTSSFSSQLGLAEGVSGLNLTALLASSLASVSFLVFINAAQGFVLTDIVHLGVERLGRATSVLILADELLALPGVLVWGLLTDAYSVRLVAVAGNWLVALALAGFTAPGAGQWKLLIAWRLLFSTGASALTVTLSGALARMTALSPAPVSVVSATDGEATPLLHSRAARQQRQKEEAEQLDSSQRAGRTAGLLGFATGCGALLAVFFFLRLPGILAPALERSFPDSDISALALRTSFWLVSLFAASMGLFLIPGLRLRLASSARPRPSAATLSKPREGRLQASVRLVGTLVARLGRGFGLAARDRVAALAHAAGFASRAQSVIIATFIPLFVNRLYHDNDLCVPAATIEGAKQSCRQAYVLSSILTGTSQLCALLSSPIWGFLSARYMPSLLLLVSCGMGTASFILFSFPPGPRGGLPWVDKSLYVFLAMVFAGASQMGGIVLSLGMVATARARFASRALTKPRENDHTGSTEEAEVAGALAGSYSAVGGLAIILVSQASGLLFDAAGKASSPSFSPMAPEAKIGWTRAPFLVMAAVNVAVGLMAAVVVMRDRKEEAERKAAGSEEDEGP